MTTKNKKEVELAYKLAKNYFGQIQNTFTELVETYSIEEMESIAEIFTDRLIELLTQEPSLIDNGVVN